MRAGARAKIDRAHRAILPCHGGGGVEIGGGFEIETIEPRRTIKLGGRQTQRIARAPGL